MYSVDIWATGQEGERDPLLDLEKNKCSQWAPGSDLPGWWGREGSTCGGAVACRVVDGEMVYVPVLCKRWSCDVCSYYRYAWLVRNLVQQIESGRLRYMWTLTLRAGEREPEQSFRELHAAWRKLRGRIARKYGGLEFVWVVETTKRGMAHLHVLVDRRLDWHWMSASWLACTGDSYVVRFDRIRNAGAARYVAKYVGKEVRARRESDLDCRPYHLFGRSQGVVFDAFSKCEGGWTVLKESWHACSTWLYRNAWIVGEDVGGIPKLRVAMAGPNVALNEWRTPVGERPPPSGWGKSEMKPQVES